MQDSFLPKDKIKATKKDLLNGAALEKGKKLAF